MHAREGIFERDAQVVAQVGTACGTASAATPTLAHEVTEKIVKDVGKGRREIALTAAHAAAGTPAAHATFKGGVAVAIIGRFLVAAFQHVISFAHFFELGFGVWIVFVAVGVKVFDLAAVGLLDLVGRGPFGNAKHLVVVTFCHGLSCSCAGT